MKKLLQHNILALALVFALASVPQVLSADTKTKAEGKGSSKTRESTETLRPKRDWYPFHGIVASIDKQANTISLKKNEGERVLKLDAKSELEINGKPVAISNVKVGDYAHGKLHKNSAGQEVITSAKFEKEAPVKEKARNQEPLNKLSTKPNK